VHHSCLRSCSLGRGQTAEIRQRAAEIRALKQESGSCAASLLFPYTAVLAVNTQGWHAGNDYPHSLGCARLYTVRPVKPMALGGTLFIYMSSFH